MLVIAGAPLVAAGFLGVISLRVARSPETVPVVLAAPPCLLIGGILAYVGLQLRARTAIEDMADDVRRPILYLRSFRDDVGSVWLRGWRYARQFSSLPYDLDILRPWRKVLQSPRTTPEELLTAVLSPFGPVVAIGRPGELVATLGARREYLGDDAWQARVTELARNAAVVLRLGQTDGLWWEIEMVLREVPPERVLFALPDGLLSWRRRRAVYRDFREVVSPLLRQSLPVGCLGVKFITFDPAGEPVLIRCGWLSYLRWGGETESSLIELLVPHLQTWFPVDEIGAAFPPVFRPWIVLKIALLVVFGPIFLLIVVGLLITVGSRVLRLLVLQP